MGKLAAIVRREYVETVRTRAFAISTVLVPLLMGLMMFIPAMLARRASAQATRLAVVDRTGKILEALDKELAIDPNDHFMPDGKRRYPVIDALKDPRVTPGQLATIEAPFALIEKLDVDVLLEIREGALGGGEDQVRYYSGNTGDFVPIRAVERALNAVVPSLRLAQTGLSHERIREATKRIDVETVKVSREGAVKGRDFTQEYFTSILLTLVLYMTTLMAGLALSRGLLEEKANRVVEVLVSSVTPFQLMTGKILGHALVILSQFGVWVLIGTVFYLRGLGGEDARKVLGAMNPTLLGFLLVYFLLGYLLYAALFAAVGAICTTEMEAQQTQTPLVLMQFIPFLLAIAIVRMPSGTLAVTLSMIPFFAPSVMMIRMALVRPPAIQIAISIVIMTISVAGAFWAVSRVFRVGILMTGKKMTLPEIWRWLRTA